MLRRRQINADPTGRIARLALGIADVVRWPFERLAWALERRLLWPLRERVAGWSPPRHAAGAGGLAVVVAAAAIGVLAFSGQDPEREQAAAPARAAIAAPAATPEQPRGRELRGVAPSFDVEPGVGLAGTPGEASPGAAAGSTSSAPSPVSGAAAEDESGAVISSAGKKPVPAGPAAMKVARRFSEAFLFYEVGQRRARARDVFAATATPRLAEALAERPPRQPQNGKVPKARILNLVPGPRAGKAYTVSVSMLRVGLTTELRLELRRDGRSWSVTDVRG
ncbi:MAG: hypothetical protein WD404_06370 [Solirubrobacterales bacterium]